MLDNPKLDNSNNQKAYNEYLLYFKSTQCVDFLNNLLKNNQFNSFSDYLMTQHKKTLLTLAIEQNQLESVNFLIENELVAYNYVDCFLHNYLHISALYETFPIFKILYPYVIKKFDINYQNSFGYSCLHYASCYNEEIFNFLIKQSGVDVYIQDHQNKTILNYLCQFSKNNSLEYILEHFNFDLNHLDKEGHNYLDACHKEDTRALMEKYILSQPKEKDEQNISHLLKNQNKCKKNIKSKIILKI